MDCEKLIFSAHAVRQMFFRQINQDEVKAVIAYGEIIEETPDDEPFPSFLLLDFAKGVPVHVVVSQDIINRTCYVVTAYIPSSNLWSSDFRRRR